MKYWIMAIPPGITLHAYPFIQSRYPVTINESIEQNDKKIS